MDVTIMQKKNTAVSIIIVKLKEDFPYIKFVAGSRACWSPEFNIITYNSNKSESKDIWGILHELGHATLNHKSYTSDIGLLRKEVAAWQKAEQLAEYYGTKIDDEYIQGCLETYRNWLYKRSKCPSCGLQGIQKTDREYNCINCNNMWSVSSSRFCRPYRGNLRLPRVQKSQGHSSWLYVDSNVD